MPTVVKLKDESELSDIFNLDWFKIVHRDNSPLFSSFIRPGSVLQNPRFEFNNYIKHQTVLDCDAYAVSEDYQKLITTIINHSQEDIHFLDRYFKLVKSDYSNLINFAQKIKRREWSKATIKELELEFNNFIKFSLALTSHMYPPLAPEEWLVNEITKILLNSNKDKEVVKKDLYYLITPEKESILQEKELAILNLSLKIKESGKSLNNFNSEIENIYDRYAWILDDKLKLEYESLSSIKQIIKQTINDEPQKKLLEIKKEKELILTYKSNSIQKYKLNQDTVTLCQQASLLPYIRNLRREGIPQALFLMSKYFRNLSQKIQVQNITKLFYWEILDALKGRKLNIKDIKERNNGFGMLVKNDTIYSMDVSLARIIKSKFKKEKIISNKITGQIACYGRAKGVARVLGSAKEIYKVEEGDILITAMTTPDFVTAMKIAGAIVTDEGGISCHAAIVAREMKKPCIIGTKSATQIFKDGDLVEVDADKGIVRKL